MLVLNRPGRGGAVVPSGDSDKTQAASEAATPAGADSAGMFSPAFRGAKHGGGGCDDCGPDGAGAAVAVEKSPSR